MPNENSCNSQSKTNSLSLSNSTSTSCSTDSAQTSISTSTSTSTNSDSTSSSANTTTSTDDSQICLHLSECLTGSDLPSRTQSCKGPKAGSHSSNKLLAKSRAFAHKSYGSSLNRTGSGGPNRGHKPPNRGDPKPQPPSMSVSDIIGSFGWFQLMVLLFSGLREASVGYDALVTSIIMQPETNFYCADDLIHSLDGVDLTSATSGGGDATTTWHPPNVHNASVSDFSMQSEQLKCMRPDALNSSLSVACSSWIFAKSSADQPSLVVEWSLVCHRTWLVAFVESTYFFGLVLGNVAWGYCADKIGRRQAYLWAHSLALVGGWASLATSSVELFALCRFVTAFGSVGYNIIYSIQVELIGIKHRSFSTILNHLGWGLGVIFVPVAARMAPDARVMLSLPPILTLIMLPWAFWMPESSRWLMLNGRFAQAKRELARAAKFNGKRMDLAREKCIHMLNERIIGDQQRQVADMSSYEAPEAQVGGTADAIDPSKAEPPKRHSVSLFKTLVRRPKLLRDTLILAYSSFMGHLFYYLLTINFGYMENLSIEANFISSGAGEWVSVALGALMLKFMSRKQCMFMCLSLMAASFGFQALIDSQLIEALNTPLCVTLNNAVGTLAALLLVFFVLIVNQEVFPTSIRQTGSSIANTLGESGSTLAPWLIHLNRLIGLWRADLICMLLCSVGMFSVRHITRTDDIELPDS